MVIANTNRTILLNEWQQIETRNIDGGFIVVAVVTGRKYTVNLFKSKFELRCDALIQDIADAIANGDKLFIVPESED